METKNNYVTVHVNIDKKIVNEYEKLYPHTRKRFLENCFCIAVKNREFFDRVFFKDLLQNANNSIRL